MSWGSGWWLSFLVTNRPPVVHKHQEKNLTAWACPSCQGPTKAICSGEHEHSGSSDSLKKIAVLFYNTGQLLRAAIGCLWFCKDSYVDFSVRDIKLFLLFLFTFLTDLLFFSCFEARLKVTLNFWSFCLYLSSVGITDVPYFSRFI